jgi:phosphoenolpyruvate synthase/pyruvate phosphate dikinase
MLSTPGVAGPVRLEVGIRRSNDGVGLAREEFIVTNYIKLHPLALLANERGAGSRPGGLR